MGILSAPFLIRYLRRNANRSWHVAYLVRWSACRFGGPQLLHTSPLSYGCGVAQLTSVCPAMACSRSEHADRAAVRFSVIPAYFYVLILSAIVTPAMKGRMGFEGFKSDVSTAVVAFAIGGRSGLFSLPSYKGERPFK